MTTAEELKQVLRETLESRGVLGQLRARIRAEIFNALDDESESKPALSHENLLLNELIREYLEYNKYRYTSSVLAQEAGQPQVPLDRAFLAHELNITQDPKASSVPLLYGMLYHFKKKAKDEGGATSHPSLSSTAADQQCEQEDRQDGPQPVIVRGGRK